MTTTIAIACALAFLVGLRRFALVRASSDAIGTAVEAMRTMRNPCLDDLAKERIVRRASLRLFGAIASILARAAGAFALAAVPLVVADVLGVTTGQSVLALLAQPGVVLASVVVMLATLWLLRARWGGR